MLGADHPQRRAAALFPRSLARMRWNAGTQLAGRPRSIGTGMRGLGQNNGPAGPGPSKFSVGGTGRAALHGGSEALSQLRPPADSLGHMTLMTPPHPPGITAVVVDVTDPNIMAEFWTFALGYVLQPPPQGFETWRAFADALDMSAEDRERYTAIMDPKGVGPRIVFQKVPEGQDSQEPVAHRHRSSSTGPCPKTSTTKSGRPG